MKKSKISLTELIFMTLCCDLGLFSKKLIAPAANIITEALHIPGGIGTSFSIMFVLVGAMICEIPGAVTLMCVIQSLVALAIGTTGSMGILAPLGYIIPGMIMDLFLWGAKRCKFPQLEQFVFANALGGISAALTANFITFRLFGPPLWLYVSLAGFSGVIFGILGNQLAIRAKKAIRKESGSV